MDFTVQNEMATAETRPVTELELGTEFQQCKPLVPVAIL